VDRHSYRIEVLIACVIVLLASGCAFQTGYNPTYLPDEEPEYLSADEVLLVMPREAEDFVYAGSPSSLTGGATNLTVPLGFILKQVAEEILEDRFSGGTDFDNEFRAESGYLIALQPSIKRFDYRYNQLKNLGFAITPQVEIDLQVEILDESGETIFDNVYESGRVSGKSYMISGSPAEKVNQITHKVIYDLLKQSFEDARPIIVEHANEFRRSDKPAGPPPQ